MRPNFYRLFYMLHSCSIRTLKSSVLKEESGPSIDISAYVLDYGCTAFRSLQALISYLEEIIQRGYSHHVT